MKITDLKPAQFEAYYKARLQGRKFVKSTGGNYMTTCPWHDDSSASFSVNFEKGVWNCFAGCGQGGAIEFEKKFSGCDDAAAINAIAELSGASQLAMPSKGGPEYTWDYRDEFGKLVFQVLRYRNAETGKKRIIQRRPCQECDNGHKSGCTNADCKHGWVWKKDGTRKLLYRLQEVITANTVICVEGEKCCDRTLLEVLKLKLPPGERVAVTTNPEGAGKWRDEFSPFVTGKKILVIPDNDEPGRSHAESVAASVSRYAAFVKVVEIPGLEGKEDIYDFFEKGHKIEEIFALAKKAPRWAPAGKNETMFVSVADFVKSAPVQKDWIIEGLIERGSNGFVIGPPKSSKSFATIDMAIAIASGQPWMGLDVAQILRVAHFSREDNPDTSSWRYRGLLKARCLHEEDVRDNIWINTRRETPRFMLDEEEWVLKAIADMKKLGTEFFILDVLNKMHAADENDNTEMRQIMDRVEFMSRESGAQWCIVHHYSKRGGDGEEGKLTEMMRGASAIAGAAEWLAGMFLIEEHYRDPNIGKDVDTRLVRFDTKSAQSPRPIYYAIDDRKEDGLAMVTLQGYEPPSKSKRRRAAAAGSDDV